MEDLPKVRLARWRGVPVYVDVTFALVPLVLFPWRLIFDVINFGWGEVYIARRLGMWAIALTGTFASILLHELGHAFAARHYRVTTSAIQIGGFYGFALMRVSPLLRRSTVPILAAGPATNLVIALAIWLALGMPAVGSRLELDIARAVQHDNGSYLRPLWETGLVWLFQLNVALAIFNMLPAFPLDGGRIARIGLRRLTSEQRAINIIAGCGCLIGAWSLLGGIVLGATLMTVGFLLIFYNYAIWRRELDAPDD